MLGKDIYNAAPMMILCMLAMLIVVVQPIIMLRIAWKRGKEMGIQTQDMKSCVNTCERSLTRTGGHGSTGEVAKIEVDGPWNLRQAVRSNVKEGADWIKVMDSHRGHFSEFTLEELCAVTDEAHRLGRKCAVHAGNEQSVA